MLSAQPEHYQDQLNRKTVRLQQLLASVQDNLPATDVFTSPISHYRMRAEFRVWHQSGKAHYAMHKPGTKQVVLLDQFDIASTTINAAMPPLLDAINQSAILQHKLFQAEFLSTQTGELLVTLIYHKPLDPQWIETATELQTRLGIYLIGRSRKQKVVLSQEYVTETLRINAIDYRYQQVENSFTQPNAVVCEKMIGWACQHGPNQHDLLELYCGNGNFTLPLSRHYDRVLATEVAKPSIKSAQHNRMSNGIENITFARLSSEETAAAIDGQRAFRRLAAIDLNDYRFSTVLVDPPRAGLDQATLDLVRRFDNILYISCNPETLVANLRQLRHRYTIKRAAAFDQFPYTQHLEAGVILSVTD